MKEHPPRAVKEPMWQTQEWCADETEHGAWKNRGTNQAEKKKRTDGEKRMQSNSNSFLQHARI